MKKLAFTLAEVLITLGIIGVVAALTIPTLMQKTNDKEKIAAVKKSFANINNAIKLAEVEHGSVKSWNDENINYNNEFGLNGSHTIYVKYIMENLKYVKACGNGGEGCFAPKGKNSYYGADWIYDDANCNMFLLTDGSALCIRDGETYPTFLLDINGPKGPNKGGVDFFDDFSYDFDEEKLVPNRDIETILME